MSLRKVLVFLVAFIAIYASAQLSYGPPPYAPTEYSGNKYKPIYRSNHGKIKVYRDHESPDHGYESFGGAFAPWGQVMPVH